jgi:hypothetical protein
VKIGDLVARKEYMDDEHVCGIIMRFDSDGDPVIYWNGGALEEEYEERVKVISETS